jgi:hypothetical protein
MFWAIYGVVFFAAFAMMVREGLWSNAISLFNIVISGLVAFSFYAPLAWWVDDKLDGEYTYVLDFVIVWALFVVAMVILRALTRAASKTRMRFRNPIDPVGGPLMALFAAWALSAFTTATLIMAPMPKSAFGDRLTRVEYLMSKIGDSNAAMTVPILFPDVSWLRFVERMNDQASFAASRQRTFGDQAYINIYRQHRERLENANAKWLRVNR